MDNWKLSSEGGEHSALGRESKKFKADFAEMRKTKNETGGDTLLAKSDLTLSDKGNAIDYLTMAVRALAELRDNPYAWKWVIISLYGAVYGFAVSAAASSDGGTNVGFKFKEGQGSTTIKKGQLYSIGKVIQICEDKKQMGRYTCSAPIDLSKKQKDALIRLKKERDQMVHFPPKHLQFTCANGDLVIRCLEVVKAIALETRTVRWDSVDERENVAALCEAGMALARNYIIPVDEG